MSKQIAVRLPERIMDFVDEEVATGKAANRAEVVRRALDRERRRKDAEHDALIYATTPDDPDMRAWVEWTSKHLPPLD